MDKNFSKPNWPFVVFLALALWAGFWLVYNAATFSVTSDETVYGPVGLRMLLKGDKILNNEHPPLNKILSGLFLIPGRFNLEKAYTSVTDYDQWRFGDVYLYESGNPTDLMMFISRLPSVILTLILIVSVYLWTKKYLGEWAGVFAAASLVLNPNILANGALTTNDLHLTAAVWFLFVGLYNLLKEPKKYSRYIWFGLALGFVLIAKFSGVYFVALAALIAIVGVIVKKTPWAKIVLGILISFVLMLALVWASYVAIEWRALLGSRAITISVPRRGAVEMKNRAHKIFFAPFLRYKEGYNVVQSHNELGHKSYLDGQFSFEGFRLFFVKTLWYKTPTVLLFLAALGLLLAIFKKKWVVAELGAVGIVFVGSASFSHIHIGVRHILPLFALISPATGLAVDFLLNSRRKLLVGFLAILVAFLAVDLALNSPNKISYFSQISGGWREGYKHLSDSNTDWGQEFGLMIKYVKAHPDRKYIIGFATGENPIYRGVQYTRIDDLGTNALCDGLKDGETLLVSVNVATGLFGPYPCVSNKIDQADRLGQTYFILEPEDY